MTTDPALTPTSLFHKPDPALPLANSEDSGEGDSVGQRPIGRQSSSESFTLSARSELTPFVKRAPSRQPIPQRDRVCPDPRCRSSRLVLRERRPNHHYRSPVPMPTRDYPCTVCGRLGIDWPHWYRPPASTTHVVQCADCLLIIAAVTVTP